MRFSVSQCVIYLLFVSLFSAAQTGPGGVGNSSNNKLWLRADSSLTTNYQSQTGTLAITSGSNAITGTSTNFLSTDVGKRIRIITSSGNRDRVIASVSSTTSITVDENLDVTQSGCTFSYTFVSQWSDVSGNSIYAIQSTTGNQPSLLGNVLNGKPTVFFDGSNDFLSIASTTWGTNFSAFVVATPKAALDGHNRILETSYSSHFYLGSGSSEATDCYKFIVNNGSANGAKSGTLVNGQSDIITAVYNGTNNLLYENEAAPGSYAQSAPATSTYAMSIGKYISGASNYFKGDLAEVIMFNAAINSAQRKIVSNYLSSKYAISISNDLYSYDATHPNDVAGIGREADGSNSSATSATIMNISSASSLDVGDYVLFGHDNASVATWTLTESHNGTDKRISREWRIDKTNDVGLVTVTLDVTTLPDNGSNDYYLLIDADGDFTSGASAYALTEIGNNLFEKTNVTITDGDYVSFAVTVCDAVSGSIATNDTLIYSGENMELSLNGYTSGAAIQWQQSAGATYSDISGATASNYSTSALTSGNTYYFRCKVTHGGCSVYSGPVYPTFKSCLNCADIGGTGDLNSTCTIATSTTIPDNKYIYGTGNLVIPTGKTLTCATGNRFIIDLDGSVDIQGTGSIAGNVTIICNALTIAGTINANSKGYLKDAGSGAGVTTSSSGYGAGGGGHAGKGGNGQLFTNSGGSSYGTIHQPVTFGSGGGSQTYSGTDGEGGTGGGAVKCIVSSTLNLTGTISVNGSVGESGGAMLRAAGGGAGGSVWIDAASFIGNGSITANGGDGGAASYDGGGGGGGRIAIYYSTNTFSGTIAAYGGNGSNGTSGTGGAGTIFMKQSSGNAELIIDNNASANSIIAYTPINIDENLTYSSILAKRKGIAEFYGTSQNISITGTLNNESNGKILFRDNVTSFNAPSITVSDSLCFYNNSAVTFSCTNLTSSGYIKFYCASLSINASGDITLNSGCTFTAGGYDKKLSIIANSLALNAGATINLTGKGYAPGAGPGCGIASNSSVHGSGGGGYGGRGGYGGNDGTRFAAGGLSYGLLGDSITNPFICGSGGGNNNSNAVKGGSGGGAIKLNISGTTTIEGTIEACGSNGTYSGTYVSGGGAGGSINISTGTLAGSGTIKVNGGTGDNDPANGRQRAGSGGGGRIAIRYTNSSFSGTLAYYAGGKSPNASSNDYWEIYNAGGAGTLFLKKDANNGNIYVNNNNIWHITMANPTENYATTDNQTDICLSPSIALDSIFVFNEGNIKFYGASQGIEFSVLKNYNNGRIIFDTDIDDFSVGKIISNDSIFILHTGNCTFNLGSLESSNEINNHCSKLVFNATSDITINSGGKIQAVGNEKSFEINASNLTVASGGSILYTGNGYASATGTGAGTSDPTGTCYGAGGAGYGGEGGYGNGTEVCPGNEPGTTYGSESMPTDFGSGGGNFTGAKALWNGGLGGGAIKIICDNDITINGTIASNGTNGTNGATNRGPGGGAGGSIWIQSLTLNGTGSITANGGNGGKDNGGNYRGGGGGGGRISICGVTTDNFYNSGSGTGTVTVNGGVGNYNPPPSGTGANGTIYANTSGEACQDILLPIELLSFEGYCSKQTVHIKWTTSSETNSDYFTLEKSIDGINWVSETQIDGAGNSTVTSNYTWSGPSDFDGYLYYRLTQTDNDGSTTTFNPITIFCNENDFEIIQIYPIPSIKFVYLNLYTSASDQIEILIQNILGQVVFQREYSVQQGLNQLSVDVSGLASSTYFIKGITSAGTVSNLKVILVDKE